ncbi:MAG: hypothetical protein WC340_05900 [Kiritimatiellia bacterium]
MKTMKWMSQRVSMLAVAVTLLAVGSGATEVTTDGTNSWNWSVHIDLDTRTMSRVVDVDDKSLDSRSYTIDWSIAGTLNTKRIIGTTILVR